MCFCYFIDQLYENLWMMLQFRDTDIQSYTCTYHKFKCLLHGKHMVSFEGSTKQNWYTDVFWVLMKLNLEIRRVKLNEVKSKKESIHAFVSILKLKKNQQNTKYLQNQRKYENLQALDVIYFFMILKYTPCLIIRVYCWEKFRFF